LLSKNIDALSKEVKMFYISAVSGFWFSVGFRKDNSATELEIDQQNNKEGEGNAGQKAGSKSV
jgi:hypothetical protein